MSTNPKRKADWIAELEAVRKSWRDTISEINESDLDRPGTIGEFSFKNIACHLNGWRELTVDRLEAAARNVEPPPFPWPDGMSEATDAGTDEINHYFQERTRDLPVADVLALSNEQFERMQTALATISEDDLLTPGRFPWLPGLPVSAVLDGAFEHLYVDHMPEIRAWLENRPR